MRAEHKTALLAWTRLLRAQRTLVERVEADLKAAGQPPLGWYDVLIELRGERAGLRQFELGERVLLAKHNLSRLLDRLQRDGHIERRPCPEDARGAVVSLTDSGTALLRAMWPVYRESLRRHFAGRLDDADLSALAAILAKVLPER